MSSDVEDQFSNSDKSEHNPRSISAYDRRVTRQNNVMNSRNVNNYREEKNSMNRSRSSKILPQELTLFKTSTHQPQHRRRRHQNGSMSQCKDEFCYNNLHHHYQQHRQATNSRQSLSPFIRRSPVNRLKEKTADRKRVMSTQHCIQSFTEQKVMDFDNNLVAIESKKLHPLYCDSNNMTHKLSHEANDSFKNLQNIYYHREDSSSSLSCVSCSNSKNSPANSQEIIRRNVSFIFLLALKF